MNYELLLFDLDGTLIDSRMDLANSVNAMLGKYGLEQLPQDTIISAVGDGVTVLLKRCLAFAGANDIQVADAKNVFVRDYSAHLTQHTRPYPHVMQVLDSLGEIAKGIVSNKPEALCRSILEDLNMSKYFECVVGGDTFSERKPSALPILNCIEQFGCEAHKVLMVGDSTNDIISARAAGAASAAVLYGYQDEEKLKREQANCYLFSFDELHTVLKDTSS